MLNKLIKKLQGEWNTEWKLGEACEVCGNVLPRGRVVFFLCPVCGVRPKKGRTTIDVKEFAYRYKNGVYEVKNELNT